MHRWFLGSVLGMSTASATPARDRGWTCTIDDPEAQDGIVVPEVPPESLMEELVEEELSNLSDLAALAASGYSGAPLL